MLFEFMFELMGVPVFVLAGGVVVFVVVVVVVPVVVVVFALALVTFVLSAVVQPAHKPVYASTVSKAKIRRIVILLVPRRVLVMSSRAPGHRVALSTGPHRCCFKTASRQAE